MTLRSRCHRYGFTLIEAVVVLGIVGVVTALTLCGVQAAREAGRRAQCLNNMMQIGLALQNYHSTYGVFPSAYATRFPKNGSTAYELGGNWGWATMILPQLDQVSLFNAVNFSRNLFKAESATVRHTRLSIFICPSSDEYGPVTIYRLGTSQELVPDLDLAPANYIASAGKRALGRSPHTPSWSAFTLNSRGDGVMYRNSGVGLSAVLDGATTTFLVGERSRNLADSTWMGSTPLGHGDICTRPGTAKQECVMTNILVLGHTGPENGGGFPVWVDQPNYPNSNADAYWSRHTGGCNFLYCDGSARFARNSINPHTFSALSTRAGAEVVDQD
jgi:prepilin-type processing-associated H-X9-DG protein/prepilin-type N-terminal cleavage/methylation domain-containing protein